MQIRGMLIFVSCERYMPFILIYPSFTSISAMVSCVFFQVSDTSLHSVEFGHDDLLRRQLVRLRLLKLFAWVSGFCEEERPLQSLRGFP